MVDPTPGRDAAALLDDAARHDTWDPGGMHAAIIGFPDQLQEAQTLVAPVNWSSFKPTTPAGICLCGMGGSAIGGDLVRSLWEYESTVPFVVVRNDRLPAFVNRFWLVIASSYSGNTTETLAATDEARRRGCRILAMTTGGTLAAQAETHGWPLITLPGGLVPRAALGYSFGPVMLALARWGIVPDRFDQLRAAADFLKEQMRRLTRDVPCADNAAKSVALSLADRVVCVYGTTGSTDVIAARIKGQLCENSKVAAFANALPELNHNEIIGMDSVDPEAHPMAVITLATSDDSAIAGIRRAWLEERLRARGIPVVALTAEGESPLKRMLSLVQQGDFISYHLAILTGHDPSVIPAIDAVKAHLATKSGAVGRQTR